VVGIVRIDGIDLSVGLADVAEVAGVAGIDMVVTAVVYSGGDSTCLESRYAPIAPPPIITNKAANAGIMRQAGLLNFAEVSDIESTSLVTIISSVFALCGLFIRSCA
jgi:hypothetical protein